MLNKEFNNPSLFLYVLPYLAISWDNIYNLGFYSLSSLAILLLGLLSISLLFECISNFKNRFTKFLMILVVNLFLLFFYGKITMLSIDSFLDVFIDVRYLRLRWFLIFLFIIQIIISVKFNKVFKFLNIFSVVFFALIIINNFQKKNELIKDISEIKKSQIEINPINVKQKPIILIITDEYASPSEIFKITKDSSVFKFSQDLKNTGWITKNSFYSQEISTIHSVSSIFNFNLSNTKEYSKQSLINIYTKKLLINDFFRNMENKQIEIINFGIFDLGNSIRLTNLYNYPENFLQQFLFFSVFYELSVSNINLFNSKSNNTEYFCESHNNFVLNKICDTIQNKQTFLYAHLYMPHSPFVLNPEFKFKIKTTNNYISYWKYVNKKTSILLKKLVIGNKYRIILTGDHGYRSDSNMNPNNTFTAFYGFKQKDIEAIKSVQDLGILINGYIRSKN